MLQESRCIKSYIYIFINDIDNKVFKYIDPWGETLDYIE